MIRGSLLAYVYIDHEQIKSEIPQQTASHLNGAHLWIGGDFNLGDINWEKETVNEYATNGTQCNQLLTITKDTFLDQVVQEPTRVTETQH